MKILFLDQTGQIGGAELSLLDLLKPFRADCLVALFKDGPFKDLLEQHQVSVQILSNRSLSVSKDSSFLQGLSSSFQLLPLIAQTAQLSRRFDLIYANTQKALVIGAMASYLSRRPLIYHLRDIISPDHFSATNRSLIINLANRFASLVIANSQASQAAFVAAGGHQEITKVVYNGFQPELYQYSSANRSELRQQLGLDTQFVVGHFSRISPWKGQHVLIEALQYCSEDVTAILVGDALFGEDQYVNQLHQRINELKLGNRVQTLGFRSDVAELMSASDLIAHTSTSPEPFGRIIVEAMLCRRPVIAAAAGGVVEIVKHGKTGWLSPPEDSRKLAELIMSCRNHPEQSARIANQAQVEVSQRFHIDTIRQQVRYLLQQVLHCKESGQHIPYRLAE
ncbi:MAG: glycosyltransferase family 4 protein [Pegethrix bostrychoides GSE-TBD4-15B]|jgi:glycosyltransferase involved in cell wall biosynthesis|uniref:Glycosyltransferase family 4 protein n=1 Tax=Pegethrix bostrychoides GSE-TBD4-15B TaxID=2839662 RepID=A0A951PF26_9CYAN|nr:glycosyltransferase family 4 protein [Pegethrix bostrychoides GSE-TBD4-15B]